MALRSTLPKITSRFLQNYCRGLSYKYDMTPNRPASAASAPLTAPPEPVEEHAVPPQAQAEEHQELSSHFRYNVCQERTTPKERPSSAAELMDPQRFHAHAAIEEQNLQPATMPEYYTPGQEKRGGPRRFQESKTRANVTLPLKQVKLANPFPDPVKQMYSRTVSDDEKAAQMLAESKSQRCFSSDWGRLPTRPPTRAYSTGATYRHFSQAKSVGTDDKKCKKLKAPKKEKVCPRMHLKGCDPVSKNIACERIAKKVVCKKQEAPYPAYSEFCHQDPDERPSECKICPWKPEEHPTFKPARKKLHTSASNDVRRTGLENVEWNPEYSTRSGNHPPQPLHHNHHHDHCSKLAADLDKLERRITAESESGAATRSGGLQQQLVDCGIEENRVESGEGVEGMLCDLSKPPCQRPPRRPCANAGKDKTKGKDKGKTKKDKGKKKKAESISNIAQMLIQQTLLDVEPAIEQNHHKDFENPIELKKKDSQKGGACKKFKFPPCKQPKNREEDRPVGKCPPKKKKPKIQDCPPSNDDDSRCANISNVIEYKLNEDDGKKKPCPKVDLGTFRDQDAPEDPCKLKKRGTTKICPGDLLKKKHKRPTKKKASSESVITPNTAPPMDSPRAPPL